MLLSQVLLSTATLSSAFIGGAAAEDVLHSQRLRKRYIDAQGNYNISFFHINDVHAHLDEFRSTGTDCTDPTKGCVGGYARVKTVVDKIRPTVQDSLFLNVGDEFQGTLFYTFYGGEKIAATINQLGFDGMTLGNHEFDGGDDKLGAFLQNLTFPIISANIQSDHPVLNKTIKPFQIYPQYDLAVIGVTTDTVPGISKPGRGTLFSDPIKAVQDTIDYIHSNTNITRIAAITHIGYEEDIKLAEQTTGLYLIMGGHSHTPLGNFTGAVGPYPTIKKNKNNDEVFIVTAYRWGEYLGYIDVTYAPDGKILAYHGGPIHMDNQTAQDAGLQAQIKEWKKPFEAFASEVLGESKVELDQTTCQKKECLLGDFMADAMLDYRLNLTDKVDFALINAGGIRATIDVGPITRGEVLTSFPFGNSIVQIGLKGDALWKVLEGLVSGVNQLNNKAVTSFFQVSRNIKVEYNPNNANGTRLVAVTIKGKPLDTTTTYQIVTLDFLAGAGDNIFTATTDFATLDTQDQVLTSYILAKSPVDIKLEGRIVAVNGSANSTGSGSGSGSDSTKPSSATSLFSPSTVMTAVFGGLLVSMAAMLGL